MLKKEFEVGDEIVLNCRVGETLNHDHDVNYKLVSPDGAEFWLFGNEIAKFVTEKKAGKKAAKGESVDPVVTEKKAGKKAAKGESVDPVVTEKKAGADDEPMPPRQEPMVSEDDE